MGMFKSANFLTYECFFSAIDVERGQALHIDCVRIQTYFILVDKKLCSLVYAVLIVYFNVSINYVNT